MAPTPSIQVDAQDYPIKSVTIFKSGKAEVVRHFPLDLEAGQTKVEISALPSTIDTQSVRVTGLGNARLHDVVCRIASAFFAPSDAAEAVRRLRVRRLTLDTEKRVREYEADLLVSYGKTLGGAHVQPEDMTEFLGKFVDMGQKNLAAIAEINEKILEVDRQIETETEKLNRKKGATRGQADIILSVDQPLTVDLKLTYIVGNVYWKPTYELHAKTENGKPSSSVALHYRARVVQSTGEDWTSTALTLSTIASDTIAKAIPQLYPVKLEPRSLFSKAPQQNNMFAQANTQPVLRPSGFFAQIQQQQQQQQQPSVFSNTHTQAQPFAAGGGGLFGSSTTFGATPAPAATSSAFGAAPATSAFVAAAPLFGTSAATTSTSGAPSTGIFGAATGGSGGGGGLFGSGTTFGAATGASGGSGGGGLFGGGGFSAFGSSHSPVPAAEPSAEEPFEEVSATEVTEPTTFVNETPVAISFSITGETSIPSDGVEHQVSVSVLPFEAVVSYIAIPRIEPSVYLQCEVKNTSDYRLLAGPVSVILDDSYVSMTSINDVNPGDNFDCTLGTDAATKLTYSRTARLLKKEGGGFSEAHHTFAHRTVITVSNRHTFALPELIVRDAVPTCDDNRARVLLRKPVGLADAKGGEEVDLGGSSGVVKWGAVVDGKGGEKEGKFEWRVGVQAKDKVVLEAEWEVKAPADTRWVESVQTPVRAPVTVFS
ncbi:hypothetical protein H0H81_004386 [Sphagnurus paluster]|uniref:Protein F37C4.5 n=1 Tax=Sphagnurus paluster TaxID=117069 RepID=A0A9P7KK07_9AGAR|nr:hypothetical protein H0H81_004386 [Sphagnurus paluster]